MDTDGRKIAERRRKLRGLALAGAALVAGIQLAIQFGGAGPASAVTGIDRYVVTSNTDSAASKSLTASCPRGHRVIGGGGWAFALAAADSNKVILTELRPGLSGSGTGFYRVTAEETTTAMTGNWWVEAYAICAPASSLRNYSIESSYGGDDSRSVKVANTGCPGGTRAVGSGVRIDDGEGEVGILLARPSGPGDITRAQAREDANGFSGHWRLDGYAVCASPPAGYEVVFAGTDEEHSESVKTGLARCTAGKQVHSTGAGMIDWAPGGTALQQLYPTYSRTQVLGTAVETTPISTNWENVAITAVCAY